MDGELMTTRWIEISVEDAKSMTDEELKEFIRAQLNPPPEKTDVGHCALVHPNGWRSDGQMAGGGNKQ